MPEGSPFRHSLSSAEKDSVTPYLGGEGTAKEARVGKSCYNFSESCYNYFESCYGFSESCYSFFLTEAQR